MRFYMCNSKAFWAKVNKSWNMLCMFNTNVINSDTWTLKAGFLCQGGKDLARLLFFRKGCSQPDETKNC